MKIYTGIILFVLFSISACKDKNSENAKQYISVRSLIEAQVKHVDSSLYSIVKYVIRDSAHIDTSYIPREKFRETAKDFLEIIDLSDKKIGKRFKEETRYDQLMDRVFISYLPINPDKEEIQKEEILVMPNAATGDKVTTILISSIRNNKDGLLQKELLWQMDKSFQVITTTQKPGQPEELVTTRVTWNDDDN